MNLLGLFDKIGYDMFEKQLARYEPIAPIESQVVRKPYVVSQRVILCGGFLEHYIYKSPYLKGMPAIFHPKSKFASTTPQEELLERNVKRARSAIRRLVNSNSDLNKFLTLTFADNVTDFIKANAEFENFIKRVRRIYKDFKYLAVPEFQKRGAIHYHLLCNLEFVDVNEFAKIWGFGFIRLNKITNVDNVGAYVCKYLGKMNFDKRLFKKKKFFYSRNLLKPLVVDKLSEVLDLLSFFNLKSLDKKFNITFDSKWFGVVEYTQYKIKQLQNIFEFKKVACI